MKTLILIVGFIFLVCTSVLAQTLTPRHGTQNGLVLSYVDSAGITHPNAFWVPAQVTFDNLDKTGSITWDAFDSVTAYNAGYQPIGGATHCSVINSTQLAAINSLPGGATVQASLAQGIGYIVANVLDTQEIQSGVPQVDANGNPIMVSFFVGATPTTAGS